MIKTSSSYDQSQRGIVIYNFDENFETVNYFHPKQRNYGQSQEKFSEYLYGNYSTEPATKTMIKTKYVKPTEIVWHS